MIAGTGWPHSPWWFALVGEERSCLFALVHIPLRQVLVNPVLQAQSYRSVPGKTRWLCFSSCAQQIAQAHSVAEPKPARIMWAYATPGVNKHRLNDATQRCTNYRQGADGQGPHLHRRNVLLWTAGGVCLFVNLHVRQRASGDKFPLETVLLALVQRK